MYTRTWYFSNIRNMSDKQHFYRKVEDQRDPNQTPEMEAGGLLSRVLSGSVRRETLREKSSEEVAAISRRVEDHARDLLKGTSLAQEYPGEFEKSPDAILTKQLAKYKADFEFRSQFKAFRIPSHYAQPEAATSSHKEPVTWENIKTRLFANDFELLRKSLKLQQGGMFIGVLDDGRICLQDRGRVPVIYAFDKKGEEKIIMKDCSPGASERREHELDEIEQHGGRFANEQEIRERVSRDGFVLPTWSTKPYTGGSDHLLEASWASHENEQGEHTVSPHIIDDTFRNHQINCQYAVTTPAGDGDDSITVLTSDQGYPQVPREKNNPARNLGAVRFLIG